MERYREIRIFEAFDGTQFYCREECEEYASKLLYEIVKDDIVLWDIDHNRIGIDKIDRTHAFRVDTVEAANYLREELGSLEWFGGSLEPGEYYWDYNYDMFKKYICVKPNDYNGTVMREYLTEEEAINRLREGISITPYSGN